MDNWKIQRTLLIVGEGYHEEAFLNHVKQLYAPRGCGLKVTIKNAHGKGAQQVIRWTCRQIANADYDSVAALLDTDADWNSKSEKLARTKKIKVLKLEPCFEAMLLRLLGVTTIGDAPTEPLRIAEWLEKAHFITHDWFMRLIEGELLEKYR
jgi:hypothetical protein